VSARANHDAKVNASDRWHLIRDTTDQEPGWIGALCSRSLVCVRRCCSCLTPVTPSYTQHLSGHGGIRSIPKRERPLFTLRCSMMAPPIPVSTKQPFTVGRSTVQNPMRQPTGCFLEWSGFQKPHDETPLPHARAKAPTFGLGF